MNPRLLILALALLLVLGGCSWIKSWGDDEIEPGDPLPLVEFTPTLQTRKLWSVRVGDGIGRQRTQLRPILSNGIIYAADYRGVLTAINAESGRKQWEVETELPFSGGPGLSGDMLMLGSQDGEVFAFDSGNGNRLWTAQVTSEVLAPPVAQDGIVVVRSIDGRVFGLNQANGKRIWIYDHSVPLLTLRGNSRPLVRAGIVFLGYDGGEVVALRLDDGTLVWEQKVVSTEGRSELERLADIDGQLVYVASDLLVSSYKNRLASLAADSGRLLWFKDVSSATGVTIDRINLAVSDRDDHIWLLDRRNGSTIWKMDQLENRGLTRPAFIGNFLVVGDFEGYLHWISIGEGSFAARQKVGKHGFTSAPLIAGNRVYVLDRGGELAAYAAGGGG
ncbi:MAG: outer membrane protein assembly factor BamB [Gammaproteobacteria bacterium]|nr:outer membrane protein assembly factor BamB [Gammaproteobacteria bacterium]NNE06453.1 outer membrane protein assembly factor BamB [Xanthomonadales bacterium]